MMYDLLIITPASINGFKSHSFHQNRLSTRLQRGRVGFGSNSGLIFVPSTESSSSDGELIDSGEGRALRSAKSACCCCDLTT